MQLLAVKSQKWRPLWLARAHAPDRVGNKAVGGNLRAGLMKSSFIAGCVSLPVFFHVQLLTSSVPYLCSTVSTGLSVYRNKTAISNFAAAGGKTATTLCASPFMSKGRKRESVSRNPDLLDLSRSLASVPLGFCSSSASCRCDCSVV